MAKIEDQRIAVWYNRSNPVNQCIVDAVYLCIKLEKEICIFANYTTEKEKKKYEKEVQAYALTIKNDLPEMDVSILVLKGKMIDLIKDLGVKYNVVMLCSNNRIDNRLLKVFYRSGFPFFFSKNNQQHNSKFKKVIIPIDFRNSTKDATLWGSYLGRFNQSEIVLYTANDKKDQDLFQKVQSTIAFVKKFYGQFFFNFWFQNGRKGSWGIHKEATKEANNYDLIIFTGSLYVTLFDWIIGPFEKRIVNRSKTSVLLINPQKEMYVICD